MRFNLPILRRMAEALRNRDWFGIGFELFVVVLGVMLGIAASGWSAEREERAYKRQILASLEATMRDYEYEGGRIHKRMSAALADFERRTAKGERPRPPIIVFPGMERPPTRAWEALVETGVARTIEPQLMFRLAIHFDQADSFGDKYQRYNEFTEREILPFEASPGHFYGLGGRLKPVYAEHIDRLRNLRDLNRKIATSAADIRRELGGKSGRLEAVQDLPLAN